MAKPTFASVTEELCTCKYLENAANDPNSPIVFDARLNEFHFEYSSPHAGNDFSAAKAQLMIYHCPFCGGAVPPSKRASLFTTITDDEEARIYRLFDGMRNLQEVIAAIGPPELDEVSGITMPEKDGQPPKHLTYRAFRYTQLSDTADAQAYVDPTDGKVRVALLPKYIGSKTD